MIGGLLLSLLGLANPLKPLLDGVASAVKDYNSAQNDKERLAAEERMNWARQQAETQIAAMQHDFILSPRNVISYAVAIYVFKLFVWDTVLGLGVTSNPGDIVNWIAAEVIAALFISRTAQTVASSFSSILIKRGTK